MESTESCAPSNKLTDGFEHAVVHVAVVVPPRATAERLPLRLLFASVWLLAPGRQAPSRPLKPYIKRFGKEGAIAVDRIVMTGWMKPFSGIESHRKNFIHQSPLTGSVRILMASLFQLAD